MRKMAMKMNSEEKNRGRRRRRRREWRIKLSLENWEEALLHLHLQSSKQEQRAWEFFNFFWVCFFALCFEASLDLGVWRIIKMGFL